MIDKPKTFPDTTSDIDAAIEAGVALANLGNRTISIDGVPVVLVPHGMELRLLPELIDARNKREAAPVRRKGEARHGEIDSFIAHVNRFKSSESAVFADTGKVTLTAVLNYHHAGSEGAPQWGDHRSVYACPLSEQWQRWTAWSGKEMSQEQFADFIEANAADIASPTATEDSDMPAAAKLLETARNLLVNIKGTFERRINPTTGASALVNKVENESTSTPIPRSFLLGIPVFEAGVLYRVEARIRFALTDGKARFSYHLYQPDVIKRAAFGEVRAKVVEGTGLPVFAGSPE